MIHMSSQMLCYLDKLQLLSGFILDTVVNLVLAHNISIRDDSFVQSALILDDSRNHFSNVSSVDKHIRRGPPLSRRRSMA